MSAQSANNKRIAKNTIFLYIRMALLLMVSLYTSRVVLDVLGVEDYGIYNVVGGVVTMLSFISSSLSGATSRFITFEIGRGDAGKIETVFRCSLTIYRIFAIIILLLAETIGLWFVCNELVIPQDRMTAALWVYQCSIIMFIVSIISIPYNAIIIANERMNAFAYISIYEAAVRLLIVFIIPYASVDRLVLYALLLLLIQLSTRFIYILYSQKNFSETKNTKWLWKGDFSRELLSYAGWTMNGNLAVVGYTQGISILLNVFFGPVVNAARGIAVQVQSAVNQLLGGFTTAIRPQIVKSYAKGDLSYMHSLLLRGTKFSFFLTLILIVPIFINVEYILQLWLKEVPEYTTIFTRLILLSSLSIALSQPTTMAVHATGKIKKFQLVEGTLLLTIVPISYVGLKWFEMSPYEVFVVYLVVEFFTQFIRVGIVYPMIELPYKRYLTNILRPIFFTLLLVVPIGYLLYSCLYSTTFASLFLNMILCVCIIGLSIFVLGLSVDERRFVISKIKALKQR